MPDGLYDIQRKIRETLRCRHYEQVLRVTVELCTRTSVGQIVKILRFHVVRNQTLNSWVCGSRRLQTTWWLHLRRSCSSRRWPLKMRVLSSFEKSGTTPATQGVTSQKTWKISSAAARTCNGAQLKIWFLGCDGPLLCCEDGGTRSVGTTNQPTRHHIPKRNSLHSHRYVNVESKKTYRFTHYTVEEQKWKGMTITLDGRTWYLGSRVIRMAAQMTQ
jgi:hypothetical protein